MLSVLFFIVIFLKKTSDNIVVIVYIYVFSEPNVSGSKPKYYLAVDFPATKKAGGKFTFCKVMAINNNFRHFWLELKEK